MKSLLASVRSIGGPDRVDHAVQLLEDEWRRHGDVPLERLWTEQKRLLDSEADGSVVLLAELVKTDLRCRFARGQTPTVAGYLERFPELEASDSRVLSLIYEEFCLAEERGGRVDVDAFCERYPRWKESLVSQLQYHHLFSQAAGARPKHPPFPEAGDTFEEFQLTSLLGRGGTSRVFLARDLSLGGKQVVLKISLDRGREPQAQGALDHPHIVPVNSVVFGDEGMRGLSMPYRAGLPLDEVIRRVEPTSKPLRAMALWEALIKPTEATTESAPKTETPSLPEGRAPGPKGDGWEDFPIRGTYPQGVAWVVKVIAEALHYAHGQQTFHRDVKPANVLLTVQHGPQLLDFNLAESPHSASQAQAAMHGGTLPYMAPEQIEAFLNPELWGKVGARADIYSLGLVLRELLTGQAPDLPAETLAPARAMRVLLDRRPLLDVSVRRTNPAIPHALEAIVAKCLAVSLEERYAHAGALAEDLDCFLRRKPLASAVNPSRRERCTNWGVRHRVRLAVAAACLALCLAFLAVGMVVGRSMTRTRPPGPIESSRELKSAVSALNEGKADRSIEFLSPLANQYPASSLPRVYLGLAYEMRRYEFEAERWFIEAIHTPNARSALVAWSPNDPKLPERLEGFAHKRLHKAEFIGKTTSPQEAQRRQPETDQYVLAKWALEISQEIGKQVHRRQSGTERDGLTDGAPKPASDIRPESETNAYNLALSEQELGDYESVVQRADQAIPIIGNQRNQSDPDFAAETRLERRILDWRQLKCRALIKWAERLRSEGSRNALKEALKTVVRAEKDLQLCSNFASGESSNPTTLHYLERIRVAALMTRVEIELDLGYLKNARLHLKRARESLQTYDGLSRLVDRTEDLDSKYERLNMIDNRLRQEEAKKAGGDSARPPRDR